MHLEFRICLMLMINTYMVNRVKTDSFPSQPVKLDLNKKLDPKQKTIQALIIVAKGFRKIRNENPPIWEIGVTS